MRSSVYNKRYGKRLGLPPITLGFWRGDLLATLGAVGAENGHLCTRIPCFIDNGVVVQRALKPAPAKPLLDGIRVTSPLFTFIKPSFPSDVVFLLLFSFPEST